MLNKKKGQITVFVILGIVVIAVIILLVTLTGIFSSSKAQSEVKSVSSFQQDVGSVKIIVSNCLRKSIQDAFPKLVKVSVNDESDYLKKLEKEVGIHITTCVKPNSFSYLKSKVKFVSNVPKADITFSSNKDSFNAKLDYEITVERGSNSNTLKSFSVQIPLTSKCCIPVSVSSKSKCVAKGSGTFNVCGFEYKVKKGDSLLEGGNCLAC